MLGPIPWPHLNVKHSEGSLILSYFQANMLVHQGFMNLIESVTFLGKSPRILLLPTEKAACTSGSCHLLLPPFSQSHGATHGPRCCVCTGFASSRGHLTLESLFSKNGMNARKPAQLLPRRETLFLFYCTPNISLCSRRRHCFSLSRFFTVQTSVLLFWRDLVFTSVFTTPSWVSGTEQAFGKDPDIQAGVLETFSE